MCSHTELKWCGQVWWCNISVCKGAGGVLSGWMFFRWRCWVPPIEPLVVIWGPHCSISLIRGCPGGASWRTLIPYGLPSRWQSLHTYFCPVLVLVSVGRETSTTNMNLLMAELHDIDPYGLYQFSSLVEKERKTFDLLHP